MDNYKPNSHRFKQEQTASSEDKKKLEKVVTGKVTKKKNEMGRIKDVFISEDASNVKSYVLMDVLVPAIKKAISDIVVNGIDMILYGETGRSSKRSSSSKVSYSRYYEDNNRPSRSERSHGYSYGEITLESREDAKEVLTRMDELVDTYGMVSVADMYELAGETCQFTDNNYGWTSIRSAEIVRARDGWMIKMPKVMPLK